MHVVLFTNLGWLSKLDDLFICPGWERGTEVLWPNLSKTHSKSQRECVLPDPTMSHIANRYTTTILYFWIRLSSIVYNILVDYFHKSTRIVEHNHYSRVLLNSPVTKIFSNRWVIYSCIFLMSIIFWLVLIFLCTIFCDPGY